MFDHRAAGKERRVGQRRGEDGPNPLKDEAQGKQAVAMMIE